VVQESPSTKSVYDFFYVDTGKIKSFYAQLTGNGSISTLKQTNQGSDQQHKEATVAMPAVAGGKLGYTHVVQESDERVYDAIPTMPREMINRLDELGYIYKELSPEMLGNLVLYKGTLGVVDVSVVKELVEPAINFQVKELSKGSAAQKREAQTFKNQLKDIVGLMKAIPYAIEAQLIVSRSDNSGTNEHIWMTLSREEMVGSPHDLNFKHGEFLAGDWYVLGVLDATPNDTVEHAPPRTEVSTMVSTVVGMLRQLFGRSEQSYSMTPIAIFRVLKPRESQ